ncbi:MAG TPA: hypothetical protein VFB78_10080 [Acidimicrobiales bacterium]|nr:hypothetical protein [Acidimicrobiales bacterium]
MTSPEREHALRELITSQPEWSDRRLASACGVSAARVAAVRRAIGNEVPADVPRLGRDGRRRRSDTADLRRRIAATLASNPERADRNVAHAVGASPATVRDVRRRMARREPVVLQRSRPSDAVVERADRIGEFTSWLARTEISETDWRDFLDVIPVGRAYEFADIARERATRWRALARQLEASTQAGDQARD